MDNASKALIIAGEILIGMLIIGIISYILLTMGKTAQSYDEHISQVEIDRINSYFAKFQSRTDITANEIVSAVNYAKEQNEKQPVQIKVIAPGFVDAVKATSSQLMDFIKTNTESTSGVKYSCSVHYDSNTGLIDIVTFSQTI